jgi:hypothetical protein
VSEGKRRGLEAASHETGLAPDLFFSLFRRIINPGEMAAETKNQSSADRRPLAAFIWRNLPCILAIYSSHPTPSPTLLMHSLAQPAVDIHHAALSSLPQALRLRPTGQHS